MAEEVDEKPQATLKVLPERFPIAIEATHPNGHVVYAKTIHYPQPGTTDVLMLPEIGEKVTLKITFSDGEVVVLRDFYIA